MAGERKNAWLTVKHPIWEKNHLQWERNERRIRGGEDVLPELQKFDWEVGTLAEIESFTTAAGDMVPLGARVFGEEFGTKLTHYQQRQLMATYINFPDMFATVMVGHILGEAPKPEEGLNFGTLGKVPRERNFTTPTDAELVFYNTDGVGNDGSQWDNFWGGALKNAMATGHRWIFVEGATRQPQTRRDEIDGKRPYLVEFSPVQVTNWGYEDGQLVFIVIQVPTREIKVTDTGEMQGNEETNRVMLMVRKGYQNLGTAYADGGWFMFDSSGELIEGKTGDFEFTRGDIPAFPFFYQRDKGVKGKPAMSRPAISELGNVAISYMNLSSAADFDAWDAAMSVEFIMGADTEGFNTALKKLKAGNRYIPVPPNKSTEQTPTVFDGSMGATVAAVFDTRLKTKREEARELAALEATSVPDSSGLSKQAGFSEAKAPRLVLMASELEQAQNSAIHFLEQRFGNPNPTGSVRWPREFALMELVEKIQSIFTMERLSGYRSATLGAAAMVALVKEKGFLSDDKIAKTVEDEYKESATKLTDAINEGRVQPPDVGQGGFGNSGGKAGAAGANGRLGGEA